MDSHTPDTAPIAVTISATTQPEAGTEDLADTSLSATSDRRLL